MAGQLNSKEYSHSKSLFKRDDGSHIVFYMRPCEEREKLRSVIEHGGGKITSKYLEGSIKLAEKGAVITTDDYLAAKYVEDCVQQNKLLDTRTYKLQKGKHHSPSKKQKKGLVDDEMEPADVIEPALYTKSRSTNSNKTEGRNMYTLEDDMAMLNYIVTEVRYNETGGYQAFRDMQVEKVTKHSFMSMHTRFRKHILPNIDKYDIPNRWKYLVTGDSKYNKHQQTGLDALFKSMEEPQNQTRSSKKKDLFSHSKLPDQLADQSENQFPQKGSNSLQTRNSSPQKIVTLDGKETSIDEPNPTISPAKRSKLIKDNSEEADKVTDMENQKKNNSSKQNTNNISSADTPKKSKKRIPFEAVEAVSFHDQTKGVEDRSDIASKPVQVTSSLDLYHIECISENESDTEKTVTPREDNSIKNHIGTAVVSPKNKKAEEKEENLNHGEPDVTKKHARAPGKQQTKANSVGVLVEQIKSPIKQQNEKDSKKASRAKIQKKGSSDIEVIENLEKSSKDSQMNAMEANNGVSVELIQVEKDQPTLQSRKASYEPLKFRKQGGDKAIQMETATEIEPENDASQTSPSSTRLQNQQDGNTMGKDTDKTLTVCMKQFPRKSVLSSSKGIPMHTKDMKNGDKHKNQLDVGDRENKVLDSDIESFATADNAEIIVDDSEDDASFITCEDEFDRHLLEKLETSNNKSGTGSDLKTQNTCMKDFRRQNANNLNHGSNEQTGNDSNSNKGKSPIKRKSDSMEQLESSDEESVKINKWRKFAPSKQKKISADAFISEDSSEPAESETADDHNSKDAKSSNNSRKPQRGKSGGGQNMFVDFSSMDSEIVEDSVEEEEMAQEVTASRPGRGKTSSVQTPPPYLEQILDTDVESQTEELTQNPAADHTVEIYNFEEDDKIAAQVEEVHRFLQRTAEQFSLEKREVFEILLSCNGDTRRAVNWILFGNDSNYLSPWRPSDDQKLMEGEDIVRLKLVYGEEEVKERALFLEIMDRH